MHKSRTMKTAENVTLKFFYANREGIMFNQHNNQADGEIHVNILDQNKKPKTIALYPAIIRSWFIPAIIDEKSDKEILSNKNSKFGSGIPNCLWSDDKIPTLNQEGKTKICGDLKPRIFYPFSNYNFNNCIPGEYNHQGTECLIR
jgi:hypothetical protein